MTSKKTAHRHKRKKPRHGETAAPGNVTAGARTVPPKLEIVVKCDTSGCLEAVNSAIVSLTVPGVEIHIISTGVGAINKSDIFMAATGSRLIVGFNVGLMPQLDQLLLEHNIEIRMYDVVYRLFEDIEGIARSLASHDLSEEMIGSARVIALFKSSRKGIIIGCEVLAGRLQVGKPFRILGAMGPKYTGKIESLHIEKDAVTAAVKGQQVGLKIKDFNRVKVSDLVESYHVTSGDYPKPWQPQGKIYYP